MELGSDMCDIVGLSIIPFDPYVIGGLDERVEFELTKIRISLGHV